MKTTFIKLSVFIICILSATISYSQEEKDGVNLYEIDVMLLQKIEELTLYIIQLENRVLELENK